MKRIIVRSISLLLMLFITGCGVLGVEDDHGHEHGDLPYEWSGELDLAPGTYEMVFQESRDPSVNVAFVLSDGTVEDVEHHAHHILESEKEGINPEDTFYAFPDYGYTLVLNPDRTTFTFVIEEGGRYLVFTEHLPEEFDLVFYNEAGDELVPENQQEYEEDDQ